MKVMILKKEDWMIKEDRGFGEGEGCGGVPSYHLASVGYGESSSFRKGDGNGLGEGQDACNGRGFCHYGCGDGSGCGYGK
jgi:hypothetical protein